MKMPGLRSLVQENWGLKLLSLAFATLLWMFVVGEKRSEVSLSLPLELTGVPTDMVVVSPVPELIRVRLNGPRTLLAAVNPQQLKVSLDLDGLPPGVSSFPVQPSRLNLPRGLEVTYISPSIITVEAEARTRKVVPIKARLRGLPSEGFEVAEVTTEPAEIEIEGAQRAVQQLKEIATETADISGLNGGFSRPVDLVLPDPSLRMLQRTSIRLVVTIREMHAERQFIQVPVPLPAGLKAGEWEILPPTVDVTVAGPLRSISGLTAQDLKVTAEPPATNGREGALRVVTLPPAGVDLLALKPNTVDLRKRHAPPGGPAAVPDPGRNGPPAASPAGPDPKGE